MVDTLKLLSDLVRIPSLSREEGVAADFLQSRLEDLGLKVNRAGCNLWVESEPVSDRPTILLNAHIDTVKPAPGYTRDPFTPVFEDGRLYGLGTNDDGASLVALLAAYLELISRPQPCRLVLSLTAEEEVTGAGGIDMILPEIGPVALGIIGEPTGMRMAVAERGLIVLDCHASGRSGHAARGEGENALYKALDDISWIRAHRFEKVSAWLGEVKMTATMISAGTQHNVVPDGCDFVVDVRPNGEYTNEEIVNEISAALSSEARPRSMRHQSSSIAMDHPVVGRGLALGLEAFGSPTTSNRTRCTFPTLKIGPGDSARSHTADEYILPEEIAQGIEIYVKLLDSLDPSLP